MAALVAKTRMVKEQQQLRRILLVLVADSIAFCGVSLVGLVCRKAELEWPPMVELWAQKEMPQLCRTA